MTIGFCGESGVGKSSLINTLINQPLPFSKRKPQKNHCRIQGIRTVKDTQLLFYDIPSILTLKFNCFVDVRLEVHMLQNPSHPLQKYPFLLLMRLWLYGVDL